MAKVSNTDIYNYDNFLDARDFLLGTDWNNARKTKSFKLEHLRYFILEGLDPSNNGFLVNNGYTLVGNILTINAGWQWLLNGMLFTNEEDIVFTLEYTAAGFVRIDSVYANSNNELLLTSGGESETIAVPPQIPINTLLAFSVNIFDTTIAAEEEPVLGNIYLKKIFDKIHEFTASGTDVVIPFNLYGRNTVILDGAMTSISGFSFSDLVENPTIAEYPHEGKLILLINRSGHNITLKNEDYASSAVVFFAFDGGNIVIPNNGKLFIKYTDDGLIDILKSWTEITDVTGLPEALDLKLNIADYNDRFKGKYTSLVNLQATHPTSNDGDTAVVDAGPGTNAIEYIWDANEGWVQGNSVGATTTDALPEGSTNLYHTAARVLATLLSGLSSSSGTFSSSDSVLTAFGKIKYLIDNIASLYVQKVTSSGVERAYIINADGSQTTKPTSEFGGGGEFFYVHMNQYVQYNQAPTTWYGRAYGPQNVGWHATANQHTLSIGTNPLSFDAQSPAVTLPFDCQVEEAFVTIQRSNGDNRTLNLRFYAFDIVSLVPANIQQVLNISTLSIWGIKSLTTDFTVPANTFTKGQRITTVTNQSSDLTGVAVSWEVLIKLKKI